VAHRDHGRDRVQRLATGSIRCPTNVYGDKTLNNYLNRAAFANPAPGTFGNHKRNSIKGPGAWKRTSPCRALFLGDQPAGGDPFEAFNLFNTFNWGNPI
jgi:hypothetical protein